MECVVRIHREALAVLSREARASGAIECCGLLAGRAGEITAIFRATNALHSPTAFEIAPAELFALFRSMRQAGLEHLGIYHSHPAGDNVPSPRDLERAFYPAAAYFILSPGPQAAAPVRAFSIRDAAWRELRLEVLG